MSTSVPPSDPRRTGQMMRALREGAGLSRRALATAAGCDHSHLARVESGERELTPKLRDNLTKAIAAHISGQRAA